MRRGYVILLAGALAAVLAYASSYLLGTATLRSWLRSPQPELAWLRREFNLSEAEFARVSELHASYLPRCRERCLRLDQLDRALSGTLAGATEFGPDLETLLLERARIRALCQAEMLKHFFAVSRTMPPHQASRYLAWARTHTGLGESAMKHGEAGPEVEPVPGHHH